MNATDSTSASFSAQRPPVFVPLPDGDDDIALGFECANPALQIERWAQEDNAPAKPLY